MLAWHNYNPFCRSIMHIYPFLHAPDGLVAFIYSLFSRKTFLFFFLFSRPQKIGGNDVCWMHVYLQVMGVLNMWRSLARRLSYPSSKSKSSFRPIGTPSMYTFTNNVRRRRADAIKALLRNGLIGGQSGCTWFLPIIRPC